MSDDFSKQLNTIINKIKGRTQQASKGIIEELSLRIVGRTPIDYERNDPNTVGYARANWIPTEGKMSAEIINELDEDDGPAPVLQPQGRTAQKIKEFIKRGLDVKKDPRYYLTNNVYYITDLEYGKYSSNGPNTVGGFSRQAPSGMRNITTAEFEEIANEVVSDVVSKMNE